MEIQKGTVVKFKFDDGSTLEWKITEPCSVAHLQTGIERWTELNKPNHTNGSK